MLLKAGYETSVKPWGAAMEKNVEYLMVIWVLVFLIFPNYVLAEHKVNKF